MIQLSSPLPRALYAPHVNKVPIKGMDTVDHEKKGPNADVHVVAVAYPGRGHVNPMMNLCALLASRGIVITLVMTEEWVENIRASGGRSVLNIRLRSIPNVVPLERHRGADFPGFVEAVATKMEAPFERFLDHELQTPINCIIADAQMAWVVELGIRRNIPVASIWTMASSVFSLLYHFDLFVSNGHFPVDDFSGREEEDERIEYIPGIASIRVADLYSIFRLDGLRLSPSGPTLLERAVNTVRAAAKAQYLLSATCYELDIDATDTLRANLSLPVYAVGPCIPYMVKEPSSGDAEYDLWLNQQPEKSVIYVSLGSFLSTSASQMDELAKGLRTSGVRCLWVGRGDEQRLREVMGCGENGTSTLAVPWCDQFKVLSHASVGGFLTHCGWNSTMEGLFCGVPMLTFPLFWDQYPNSKLIVEDWGVGMRLKREVGENVLIGSHEIAELVQKFMAPDGEESKGMRNRSSALQKICKTAVEEDGSAHHDLDAFISQIKSLQSL